VISIFETVRLAIVQVDAVVKKRKTNLTEDSGAVIGHSNITVGRDQNLVETARTLLID
jgi:hypothetical protein